MIKILIWENTEAPKNSRFMARLLIGDRFSTVVAHGDNREELNSRMERFVEAETKRYSKPSAPEKARPVPTVDLDDLLS